MDKIQNTKDLAYFNNAILLIELINKKVKDNIDDKEIEKMQSLIVDVCFYVNNLQTHIANCKVANSQYRELRNDALLELNELKEDIKEYEL